MPLGQREGNIEDLIADMIREEVDGIKAYERLLDAARGDLYLGSPIKNEAVRNAIINEIKKITNEERNHVLMLRAIQDKLYE